MTKSKGRTKHDPKELNKILDWLHQARNSLEQHYGQAALEDATVNDSGGMGLVKHAYHLRIGYARVEHARRQLMKYIAGIK